MENKDLPPFAHLLSTGILIMIKKGKTGGQKAPRH